MMYPVNIRQLLVTGRSATLQIEDGGLYSSTRPYRLFVNDILKGNVTTSVFSVFGLSTDCTNHIVLMEGDMVAGKICVHTEKEACTLDIRDFGAAGDGVHDDTAAVQTAVLCCPKNGRILFPAGKWLTGPIFLKNHIRMEIAKNAEIRLIPDRERVPVLPGMVQSSDEKDDYNFASWEGNPLDSYASLITGMGIKDVVIYGEGVLNGQGDIADWWQYPKERKGAYRPRMVFLNHCEQISMQGLTLKNSPAWNIHPYFSEDLKFLNLTILAPSDSPNTDGFDPESCRKILMSGTKFSLGDDCIAIKSGKIYMGRRYKTPCEDIEISHCLMENGHGGVTIGSEMSGGVKNIRVQGCLMRNTDRGLRIKTRRGRGKDAIVDDIRFRNVRMESVRVPLVVNSMYECDTDGKSEYVQSREALPVTDDTPEIGSISFENVYADDITCAGYVLGLPEKPVHEISLMNVEMICGENPKKMIPALTLGIGEAWREGFTLINIEHVRMKNVKLTGNVTPRLSCDNVVELDDEP